MRPFATWRIWRQMRIHEVRTYAGALDRDAARAAVIGRLRLHHGRMWRSKAPLAERIALRIQGRDPAGVAAILSDHAETAALLAAPTAITSNDGALQPLDPIIYPPSVRPVLPSFTALVGPFSGDSKALTENERDAAIRMRGEGLSLGVIADRLGRSKSWVHGVVTADPVEHVNGSAS
jgi:hypothetical protein